MLSDEGLDVLQCSQTSSWFYAIMQLALDQDWEALALKLSQPGVETENIIISSTAAMVEFAQLWEDILCSGDSFRNSSFVDDILSVIRAMIHRWGPGVVEIADDMNCQTPLHMAAQQPCDYRIVQALAMASPRCAHFLDDGHQRPIDHLSQKIVMMEERAKYHQHQHQHHRTNQNSNGLIQHHAQGGSYNSEENERQMMDNLWECVRIVALAMRPVEENELQPPQLLVPATLQPMLHVCLLAQDFPTALMERVLQRYPEQLRQADANGNLPLHLIASRRRSPPPQQVQQNDEAGDEAHEHRPTNPPRASEQTDDNTNDDDLELLNQIVSLYPDAAKRRNHLGQCPLDVAIEAHCGWRSGIRLLLQAFPEALVGRDDILLEHFPLILRRFMIDSESSTVGLFLSYALLRATPALFQR